MAASPAPRVQFRTRSSVTLTWDTHPEPMTNYKVSYTVSGTEITCVKEAAAPPVTLDGLSPGGRYTVTVVGVRSDGSTVPIGPDVPTSTRASGSETPPPPLAGSGSGLAAGLGSGSTAGSGAAPGSTAVSPASAESAALAALGPPTWAAGAALAVSHESAVLNWTPVEGALAYEVVFVPVAVIGHDGERYVEPGSRLVSWPPHESRICCEPGTVVTALAPATVYSVVVRTVNEIGERGPESEPRELVTPPEPAEARSARNTQAELTLRALDACDAAAGVPAAAQQAEDDADADADADARPSMSIKQQYLRARRERMGTPPSSPTTGAFPASQPDVLDGSERVSGLALAAASETSLSLVWTALPGACLYHVSWSLAGTEIEGQASVSTASASLTRLSPGCEYTVTVTPEDATRTRGFPTAPLVCRTLGSVAIANDAPPASSSDPWPANPPAEPTRKPSHTPTHPVDADADFSAAPLTGQSLLSRGLCTAGPSGRTRFFQLRADCTLCGTRICRPCLAVCHAEHAADVVVSDTYAAFICACGPDCKLRSLPTQH